MHQSLTAEFVKSSTRLDQCPEPNIPEVAFIGRSNVGKSSLINMIVGKKGLAKVSSKPGKTQTINHFRVSDAWYLVDLPGYGFAGVSQTMRAAWSKMMDYYFSKRTNLVCVFVLIDSRLPPQKNDIEFLNWLGTTGAPIALVFTKIDKVNQRELAKSVEAFKQEFLKYWEDLPPVVLTSAEKKKGREEILSLIDDALKP